MSDEPKNPFEEIQKQINEALGGKNISFNIQPGIGPTRQGGGKSAEPDSKNSEEEEFI